MWKKIVLALIVFVLGLTVGLFVFKSEPKLNGGNTKLDTKLSTPFHPNTFSLNFGEHPFRLGLDLSGGSHLIYKADVSAVKSGQVGDSMDALRDVIERRINIFTKNFSMHSSVSVVIQKKYLWYTLCQLHRSRYAPAIK